MRIDDTREDAIRAQTTTTTGMQFFTDGSGFNNGIGAAAYSTLGYIARPVGSSDTHTVYAGELEGIDAALSLMIQNQHHSDVREATIYTDNQAAIRATCHPQRSSGQYILRRIVRQLDLLRDARSRWRVRLQWVPGHEGVPGNEEADRLAKLAAVEATQRTRENMRVARINAPNQTTPHAARVSYNPYHSIILVAVCRQRLRAGFANRWKEQWDGAEHGRHLYRIVQTPAKKVLQLHEGLKRAWSSVLVQLQTGKSALRSFLASVKIEDSPLCQCGLGNQDTAHVLVRCPLHADLRTETLYKEARETDDRRLLSEPHWVRRSIEFVLRTGLMTQFRNAIPPV
jgi:ribonuclease HI